MGGGGRTRRSARTDARRRASGRAGGLCAPHALRAPPAGYLHKERGGGGRQASARLSHPRTRPAGQGGARPCRFAPGRGRIGLREPTLRATARALRAVDCSRDSRCAGGLCAPKPFGLRRRILGQGKGRRAVGGRHVFRGRRGRARRAASLASGRFRGGARAPAGAVTGPSPLQCRCEGPACRACGASRAPAGRIGCVALWHLRGWGRRDDAMRTALAGRPLTP